MKTFPTKNFFAFIITVMIFSAVAEQTIAQTTGKKKKPIVICNCFVRPIPFECGRLCGFVKNKTPLNETLSISSGNSNAISFQLRQAQNVSAKIYDATGRLVKTIANKIFEQGEHSIEWNKTDGAGNTVSAGIYVLWLVTNNKSETKKIEVSNS